MTTDAFGLQLRTVQHEGQPYFHLLDVVRALRTAVPSRIVTNLDADEFIPLSKITGSEADSGRFLVTEPALFKIAIRMHSPEARAFLRYVCHDVLPAIRERGAYRLPAKGNAGANLVRYLRGVVPTTKDTAAVATSPASPAETDVPW